MAAQVSGGDSEGDPETVNLSESESRAFWARRFQLPIEQVESAVEAVGNDPAKVAERLGKPWPFDGSGIV